MENGSYNNSFPSSLILLIGHTPYLYWGIDPIAGENNIKQPSRYTVSLRSTAVRIVWSTMQKREEFCPGATIIKQGEEGAGFYILEKGTVEVYKDDLKLNVLMFPGTIFGEMGSISNKPRTCTIKARHRPPSCVMKPRTWGRSSASTRTLPCAFLKHSRVGLSAPPRSSQTSHKRPY